MKNTPPFAALVKPSACQRRYRASMSGSALVALVPLLVALVTSNAAKIYADDPIDIRFRRVSLKDGLSHPRVYSFHQDPTGFVWFGTEDGLNRGDGNKFRVFRPEPQSNHEELKNYAVRAICGDSKGYLWLGGFFGRRLDRFDPRTHQFIGHHRTAGLGHILTLRNSDNDTIWVGTSWTGLWSFDPAKETFTHFPLDVLDGKNKRKGRGTIYKIFATDSEPHKLWLQTQFRGLVRFDTRTGEMRVGSSASAGNHEVPPPERVDAFLNDADGLIWVAGGSRLLRFDPNAQSYVSAIPYDHLDDGRAVGHLTSLTRDRRGRIWVGSSRDGIARLDTSGNKSVFHHYTHKPFSDTSIPSNAVSQLYADRSGKIWVTSRDVGLCVFDPEADWIRHLRPGDESPNGPDPISAACFFQGNDRQILWLGTDYGITRWNRNNGTLRHFRHDPSDPTSLSSDVVLCLAKRKAGGFWIGTKRGVCFYDPETDRVQRCDFSGAQIWALLEDDDDRLWMGKRPGFDRVNLKTKEVKHYRHDPQNDNSIAQGKVQTVCQDEEGMLWLGAGGLMRFDPETEEFTRYVYNPANAQSISDNRIRRILEDSQASVMWVATAVGLNRLDTSTHKFTRFTEVEGLPSDNVLAVLQDDAGDLWVSTTGGLAKISDRLREDPRILTFQNVGGVPLSNFREGALALASGRLLFRVNVGIIEVDPQHLPEVESPTVAFTDFRLLNQSVSISNDGSTPLSADISAIDEVVLTHTDNKVFTLEFSALDEPFSSVTRYAYYLDGLEHEWSNTGNEPRATYSTLPVGKYTFRVKAANSYGVWSDDNTSIRLTVLAPWWATWWFRSAAFFAVTALTAIGVLVGNRRIRHRNQRLKAIIDQREQAESREKLRSAAVETMVDACVIVDARAEDLPIVYANQQFQKITGYAQEETLGKNCRFLQGEQTASETVDSIRTAIAGRAQFQGEILNYRKSGEPFWNFLRLSPVFDDQGELTHYVGVLSDVTDRKKAEETIQQQRYELAHVSRMATLGEISGALAHELNQPLAAVLRNAQAGSRLLERDQPDLVELREILTDIARDDRRAGAVVERLRTLLSKKEHPLASLDLNDVIRDSLATLQSELLTKRVDIRLQLDAELPAVYGDSIGLQQVLINLVMNALQAMDEDTVNHPQLTITSTTTDSEVQVSVSDSGPGIHPRDLERVFTPFHTTKAGGMGMGLSINRTIINAHHGRIWAEQNEGGGVTLVFSLPVHHGSAVCEEKHRQTPS